MMNMLRDMQTELKSMSKQLAEVQKDVKFIKARLDGILTENMDIDSPCRKCPFWTNGTCNGRDAECYDRKKHEQKKAASSIAEDMMKSEFDMYGTGDDFIG